MSGSESNLPLNMTSSSSSSANGAEGGAVKDFNCPALCDLADEIGTFIEHWGFKKVHGRIWTHLFLAQRPLDAMELRTRLRISKALVSLSVHDLMHYSVIREVGKSPKGTILYEANPDLKEAIFNVLKTRERQMIARVNSAHKLVAQLDASQKQEVGIDSQRFHILGNLIEEAQSALDLFLQAESLMGGAFHSFLGAPKEASGSRL